MTSWRTVRIAAEMAGLFLILFGIERVIGPARFGALQPHPYWLPVLAMAVAYGSASGIAAGLVATALWLVVPHPAAALAANPFDRSFMLALPPLLWLTSAVAIGEVTEWRHRAVARERRKVATLFRQQDALLEECRGLVAVNRDFQMAFVTGEDDRRAMVHGVLGVQHAEAEAAGAHLLDLIERATGTREASVYLADDASLRLFASEASAAAPDHLAGLLRDAIDAAALPISVEDEDGRALLEGLGVLAAPLRPLHGSPLVGAILFHAAPTGGASRAALIELADFAETLALVLTYRAHVQQRGLATPGDGDARCD